MGAKYQFQCESCGYKAMVSGSDDFGFKVYTTTILCADCEELYDVATAKFPPVPHESGFEQSDPLCPKNREHSVRRWRDPGPCPKCGQPMVHGEEWLLWD